MKQVALLSLLLVAPAVAHGTAAPADKAAPAAPIVIAPAPADKGQIVFYRPGGGGGLVGCMVREGEGAAETHISKLTGNRYFTILATPGVHKYWVKSEATDRLSLEIEPGETYYVKCKITMGFMVGRPNMSPSDANEFETYKKKLKLMDPAKQGDDAPAATPAKAS
jgi:hypothetical protein